MADLKNLRLTQSEWERHRRLTEQSSRLTRLLKDNSWDALYAYSSGTDPSGNNSREWVELPLNRDEARAAIQTAKLRIDVELRQLESTFE